MNDTRVIGLDVGTSSLKGVAVDGRGSVVAWAERPYPVSRPRPGWSEQDPESWWEAAQAVLQELDAEHAAGIGLTGQMHGLVVLDGGHRPLRPAILWNDGRSQPQATRVEQAVGVERLVALSGNRVLAGFTAPKLVWLREHEPDLYARVRHVLLPKDYVRLRLTGELATDVADASGTVLLDVAARAWSDELAAIFDVDPAWLPAVHESQAITGATAAGVPGIRPRARSESVWWMPAAPRRSSSAPPG
jgi:xylulokinase